MMEILPRKMKEWPLLLLLLLLLSYLHLLLPHLSQLIGSTWYIQR